MDEDIDDFVRREYGRLVRVVALVTGSVPLAEESVQEALARAVERSRRGRAFEHLGAWVVTVAMNHARSGRRRAAAERRALTRLASRRPVDSRGPSPASVAITAALDHLARRQRDVVVLYYLLDLDVATVARLLAVSEGTVKTALSRARHNLAPLLADRELEPE